MHIPDLWNRAVTIGWLAFFGIFMGLDMAVWLTKNPHIPTFSRVVCRLLPAWVVLPLTALLFIHFVEIYLRK